MDMKFWQFGPVDDIEKSSFKNQDLLKENVTLPVIVLEIKLNRTDDSLMIYKKIYTKLEKPSKRQILSITQVICGFGTLLIQSECKKTLRNGTMRLSNYPN